MRLKGRKLWKPYLQTMLSRSSQYKVGWKRYHWWMAGRRIRQQCSFLGLAPLWEKKPWGGGENKGKQKYLFLRSDFFSSLEIYLSAFWLKNLIKTLLSILWQVQWSLSLHSNAILPLILINLTIKIEHFKMMQLSALLVYL